MCDFFCLSENAISLLGPFRADAPEEQAPSWGHKSDGIIPQTMIMFIFPSRENKE